MGRYAALLSSRLPRAGKLCVLGVGSPQNGDDAAGALIAGRLKRAVSGRAGDRALVIEGGTAPENFTGEIRSFAPAHLLLIDAADFGSPIGTAAFLDPAALAGISFSTHTLPLKIILNYLCREVGCDYSVIGIQPASTVYGDPMSRAVRRSVRRLTGDLRHFIRRME